jgi:hypothetical protein
MKKILFALSICCCTAVTMSSCDNGAYDADPNTNNSGTSVPNMSGGGGNSSFSWSGKDPMSAKINGASFQATTGSAAVSAGKLVIGGSAGTDATITLAVPANTAAGATVDISDINTASYIVGGTDIFNTVFGGSGAIKIIENDATHVKGLFYFSAKNAGRTTKNVTEGYFNIRK